MISSDRLDAAYQTALAALMKERHPDGYWVGELSTSALSTATAVMALQLVQKHDSSRNSAELIERGLDWLAGRSDVDAASIRAAARGVAGVWLLMAAAVDNRLTRLWVDGTPYSLRAALERPLHKNLHAAVIPGFCLRWDLDDLRQAIMPPKSPNT